MMNTDELYRHYRKLRDDYQPTKAQVAVWDIPDATKPSGYDRGMLDIVAANEQELVRIFEKAQQNGGKVYQLPRFEPAPLRYEPVYTSPQDMRLNTSFAIRPPVLSYVIPTTYESGGSAIFTTTFDLDALIASKRKEAYKTIAAYAQTFSGSNHRRFRIERKLQRWWEKQVKQLTQSWVK